MHRDGDILEGVVSLTGEPMSVDLPADLAQFVHEAVASGTFASERDVMLEALRMLRDREQLRRDVQEGFDELREGKTIDGDELFRELRARFVERRQV
jgi:putative addiction module CopG family antidote